MADNVSFFDEVEELQRLGDLKSFHYYNKLLNKRTVILDDIVDEYSLALVALPLLDFESDDSDEPVTLIINCVGGSFFDGFYIADIIDNYKKKLNIELYGYAFSMAAIILCAGKDNPNVTKRCRPHSYGMFHAGDLSLNGDAKKAEDFMDFNKKLQDQCRDFVLSHSTIPESLYEEKKRVEWYLTADELIEYQIIDEIIS